jgi:hypothetical protein
MAQPRARPNRGPEVEIIRLEYLAEYGLLAGFRWPEQQHDPARDWALGYVAYIFPNPKRTPLGWGHVTLTKRGSAQVGCFELSIKSEIADDFHYWQQLDATLTCRNEATATPVAWSVKSSAHTPEGETIAESVLAQSGAVESGTVVHRLNGVEVRNAFAAPLIEARALYPVVMGLPAEFAPIEFTLLDDLRMVKAGHRLQAGGTQDFTHAGETRRLRRVLHTGRGIFPAEYWVNESGHLLFAISDLNCFVLHPTAATFGRSLVKQRAPRVMRSDRNE